MRDPEHPFPAASGRAAGRSLDVMRTAEARRPLYLVGAVLFLAIPALFGALWLVAGRDGSADQKTFAQVLTVLALGSMALGALALSMAGFLRLVTGRRGRRPIIPALPENEPVLRFLLRRTARIDLRILWLPALPFLVAWSFVGTTQPTLPPGAAPLILIGTGLSFFAFLYFWSVGFLRVYSVGRRPSFFFLAAGALAWGLFLLPFLVADPTRYPGLFPARGIVLLGRASGPILPLP